MSTFSGLRSLERQSSYVSYFLVSHYIIILPVHNAVLMQYPKTIHNLSCIKFSALSIKA